MRPSLLRRVSVASFAIGLLAISASPSACKPTTCTLLACDSVHARLTVHVKVPLAELVTSKITVCWRETCGELVALSDAGTSPGLAFGDSSPLRGEVTASAESPDSARLEIELTFFTRGQRGDFVYTRQADGDRYRVTAVDVGGVTLLDAERSATYTESYPNGADCDPEPCRATSIDLAAP